MAKNDFSKNQLPSRLGETELELMHTLFEQAPMFVGVTQGPEHRVTYMNAALRKLLGNLSLPPGTSASEILPVIKGGDLEEVKNSLQRLDHIYVTGEPLIVNEFKTTLDRKGKGKAEEVYINSVYQPLKDEGGEVYGLFLAGYEVTEHVHAREEIIHGEHRLALALNGARMGYWEVDVKGNKLDVASQQFKEHYGFPVDKEPTYENIFHAIHPEDRPVVQQTIDEAMRNGQPYEMQYRVRWPDGSLHWLMSRGRLLRNRQGRPYRRIGVTMDITPHKRAERKLEETVRLRDDFLAIASHELQTPLTSMKMKTQLVEQLLEEGQSKESISQVGKINDDIDRLSSLVNKLLDLSRLRQDGLSLNKQLFSLDTLMEEKVVMLQSISPHEIEAQGHAALDIYGDRDRIGQVLTNLLENAVKYSPEPGRVIVEVARKPDEVVISVTDFGIGIPNREKVKVFDRFYKGQDSERKTYPGFGIGLHIARQIVEHHGGGIWVEDNPEGGSVFSFSLPLVDSKNC